MLTHDIGAEYVVTYTDRNEARTEERREQHLITKQKQIADKQAHLKKSVVSL